MDGIFKNSVVFLGKLLIASNYLLCSVSGHITNALKQKIMFRISMLMSNPFVM